MLLFFIQSSKDFFFLFFNTFILILFIRHFYCKITFRNRAYSRPGRHKWDIRIKGQRVAKKEKTYINTKQKTTKITIYQWFHTT